VDPLVSPAVIPGGEPSDQYRDLGADRRPPLLVRIGPPPGDQAAVPPQDGARGDQPVYPNEAESDRLADAVGRFVLTARISGI